MPRAPRKEQTGRLAAITLDEASLGGASDDIEHERRVAIYDLIEANNFQLAAHHGGPYALRLGMRGDRLVFDIRLTDGTPFPYCLFLASGGHTQIVQNPVPQRAAKRHGGDEKGRISNGLAAPLPGGPGEVIPVYAESLNDLVDIAQHF